MGMRQRCGKRGWFRPVFSGRVFAEAAMGTVGNRGIFTEQGEEQVPAQSG
jgi:hypothetical protein